MLSKSCCTLSSKRGISRVKCCCSIYKRRWGKWLWGRKRFFLFFAILAKLVSFISTQTCLPLDILDASEQSWEARTPEWPRSWALSGDENSCFPIWSLSTLRNVMPFLRFGQLSVFSSCTKLSEALTGNPLTISVQGWNERRPLSRKVVLITQTMAENMPLPKLSLHFNQRKLQRPPSTNKEIRSNSRMTAASVSNLPS